MLRLPNMREVLMNWLDIAILLIIGVFTFLGLKRGLIQAVVPLIGLVLAIYLAGRMHESLAKSLGVIDNESVANIVAFGIILGGVFIVVSVIAITIKKFVSVTFLGWLDKQGGAVFGFIVGWLICSIVVAVIAREAALPADVPDIPDEQVNEWVNDNLNGVRETAYNTIDESALATFQIDTFPIILGLLPSDFDSVQDFFGN